jgi:hypothetical protein
MHRRPRFQRARVAFIILPYDSSTVHIVNVILTEAPSPLHIPTSRYLGALSQVNAVARNPDIEQTTFFPRRPCTTYQIAGVYTWHEQVHFLSTGGGALL